MEVLSVHKIEPSRCRAIFKGFNKFEVEKIKLDTVDLFHDGNITHTGINGSKAIDSIIEEMEYKGYSMTLASKEVEAINHTYTVERKKENIEVKSPTKYCVVRTYILNK